MKKGMKFLSFAGPLGLLAVGVLPATVVHAETVSGCEVSDVTVRWGTLERWRSYVSGAISQGGWETDGDASYEMPEFVWSEGTGTVNLEGAVAELSTGGAVRFNGHNDLLQVSISNPVFEVVDSANAVIKLDLEATDMTGAEDVSSEGVEAATFTLDGGLMVDGDTLTLRGVDGVLTDDGVTAFGGFYEAGEPVDPITVTATISPGCGEAAVEPEPEAEPEPTETPELISESPDASDDASEESSDFPVAPVVIGGVALLVIVGAAMYLIGSRKKRISDPEEG